MRRAAEVASFVAATEEKVASTLEKVAEHRAPHDAMRLRAKAQDAREYAAKVRDRSTSYDPDLPADSDVRQHDGHHDVHHGVHHDGRDDGQADNR